MFNALIETRAGCEVFTLNSVSDLLEQVATDEDNEVVCETGAGWDAKFMGTANFAEAVELYERGWSAGVEALNLDSEIAGEVSRNIYSAGVTGYAPNVGRYLTGRPDCMRNKSRRTVPAKTLRILIAANLNSTYTAAQINSAARIIVQALISLEQAGASLEIYAGERKHGRESWDEISIRVKIKGYQDTLSVNDLAFCCGHSSFKRRFLWSYENSLDSRRVKKYGLSSEGGYGTPLPETDFDGAIINMRKVIDQKLTAEKLVQNIIESQSQQ